MQKLKTCLILIFFSCCFSAFTQTSKVDSTAMLTLRIDPESARGASVSQVFDEVHFIPLETTKESLFGSISQMQITESSYIIYDYDTKSVLIFSKDGKFKAKLNGSKTKMEEGEKEDNNFYGFSMKHENNKDLIQIYSRKYLVYFDLEGKLIKKTPVEGMDPGEGQKFTDQTRVKFNHLVKRDNDSLYYEIALLKDNKEVGVYFPFSMDRYKNDQFYSGGKPVYDCGVPDELFYLRFYEYNIYKITPKKVELAYHIIFPAANSLPTDFKDNPVYKNKRREYFEKYPNAIYALSNTYKIGDLLFLKMHSWEASNSKKNALIYNLKTEALTSITDLEPDSASSFLPVTDAGVHYDFLNRGFHAFDGKYLYTSYSSLAAFAFRDQSAGKNPKYTAAMSNYFKTENKKSNPILIQLKPKQD
ncbi:6-bladed beta-propeller [Arcticibacter tournemirensis]|uniref:6-bladed beta-propeller n=1 Tax=Arcticibacter tournemirensis TaxID=699437 RepID=A0A4Q0M5P9_9SPHI|nr:6-bladed beta-propeller [Arcticibacter tournemirensis]RXF68285.1 6-bladed beta-propeller [Arcticibacter tournemirensis]